MARTPAAESPVGIVEEPCPAPLAPSPRMRAEAIKLLIEPRVLTTEDFKRFLGDPDIVRFNEEMILPRKIGHSAKQHVTAQTQLG